MRRQTLLAHPVPVKANGYSALRHDREFRLHFNAHAQMLMVPPPGKPGPSVPLVIFPNGYHVIEPRPREFVMTIVEHGLM